MNDTNPFASNPQDPQANPYVAFCQNCGTSLTASTVRRVGPAVYCEPCLEARLAGAPPAPGPIPGPGPIPPPPPGYGPVHTGPAVGSSDWVNAQVNTAQGQIPFNSAAPNPGLAALLGLIPGVGAMYNEQYAKGVAHLVIFAVLVSLEHVSFLFFLFTLGWVCYMSIEAHHTARARRDGTPLPNPFGLNDIGDRMGFGKTWPNGPDIANSAREAARDAFHTANAGFNRQPIVTPPPPSATSTGWGAPTDAYPPNPGYNYVPPTAQPYTQPYAPPYTPPYTQTQYAPIPPMPDMPVIPPTPSRFPSGALWLISLGLIFLLSSLNVFNAVPGSAFVGVALLVFGVWFLLHRMMDTGQSLAYDGTPAYHLRVLRALRGSIWFIAIGILWLLDSFHLVHWHDSWPWLIILVGLMMLLQRAAYNHAAASFAQYPPAVPATPVDTPSSIKTDGGN